MGKTALYLFTIILISGGADFAVVYFFPTIPSISSLFVDMNLRAPYSIFVCGVITGHLFFPTVMRIEKKD